MMASCWISPDEKEIHCLRCDAVSFIDIDIDLHYCRRCQSFHDDVVVIEFWVIYFNARDAPGQYALRRHFQVKVPGKEMRECQDEAGYVGPLNELRSMLPPGATWIGREPDDDPVIYEVWIK